MRILVLSLVVLWAPAAAAEEISIAVMEFASKGGVSQEQMDALSDMLANEIRDKGRFRVIGKSDIRTALKLEERKAMLGCTDNVCIAEIGGALGVKWVVVGNISQFGEVFLLNLKLMNAEAVKVAWGVSKKVTGSQDKLIDALSVAAAEMVGAVFGVEKKDAVVAADPAPLPPSVKPDLTAPMIVQTQASDRFNTWGHVTFWSGLGLVTLGGLAGGVAAHEGENYSEGGQPLAARLDSADQSRAMAGVMWIGFGLGTALITTGVVLWLLEPDSPAAAATLGPSPDGRGVALTWGGRW